MRPFPTDLGSLFGMFGELAQPVIDCKPDVSACESPMSPMSPEMSGKIPVSPGSKDDKSVSIDSAGCLKTAAVYAPIATQILGTFALCTELNALPTATRYLICTYLQVTAAPVASGLRGSWACRPQMMALKSGPLCRSVIATASPVHRLSYRPTTAARPTASRLLPRHQMTGNSSMTALESAPGNDRSDKGTSTNAATIATKSREHTAGHRSTVMVRVTFLTALTRDSIPR